MAGERTKIVCKNVFKNGESTLSKDQYTRKWITVINQLEKHKK